MREPSVLNGGTECFRNRKRGGGRTPDRAGTMTNTPSILNQLIEILKDGQEGFRAAATDVEAADLKALFSEYSSQRAQYAAELQSLARSLGETSPETSGSVAGALHRGWIDLKAKVTGKDAHAILAECERGEDSAVAAYQKALDTPGMPMNVVDTLRVQGASVKAAHDRVRDLRDSLAKK